MTSLLRFAQLSTGGRQGFRFQVPTLMMDHLRQRKGCRPASKQAADTVPIAAVGLETGPARHVQPGTGGMVLRTRSGRKLPEAVLAQAIAQVDLAAREPRQRPEGQESGQGLGDKPEVPKPKQRRQKAAVQRVPKPGNADEAAVQSVPEPNVADEAAVAATAKAPRKRKAACQPEGSQKHKPAALIAGAPSHELAVWTDESMEEGLRHLRAVDEKLGPYIDAHAGYPIALQARGTSPMFASLTRSIVGQQLAVAAVKTIYGRFLDACKCTEESPPSPAQVLSMPTEQLRACGLSGAKTSYIQDLARHFESGQLTDEAIALMDDEALILELTKVKGIGRWSVDMFSMFHLGRPDVLPVGDLGVRNGMKALYGLKEVPKPAEMEQVSDKWRPYRSLGSYFMWRVVAKKGASAKTLKKTAASKVPIAADSKVPAMV